MSGRITTRFRRKVVLYAVWHQRLLVFSQPDFPDAGIQVPGGTLTEGESPEDGARREFHEETGLQPPDGLRQIGRAHRAFQTGGVRHEHDRYFFYLPLAGAYPEHWEWTEKEPDIGEGPIRFAFRFVSLNDVPTLSGGLGALLPELRRLLSETTG